MSDDFRPDYAIAVQYHPKVIEDGKLISEHTFTLHAMAKDGITLTYARRRRAEACGDLEKLVEQLDRWMATNGTVPPAFEGGEDG